MKWAFEVGFGKRLSKWAFEMGLVLGIELIKLERRRLEVCSQVTTRRAFYLGVGKPAAQW